MSGGVVRWDYYKQRWNWERWHPSGGYGRLPTTMERTARRIPGAYKPQRTWPRRTRPPDEAAHAKLKLDWFPAHARLRFPQAREDWWFGDDAPAILNYASPPITFSARLVGWIPFVQTLPWAKKRHEALMDRVRAIRSKAA